MKKKIVILSLLGLTITSNTYAIETNKEIVEKAKVEDGNIDKATLVVSHAEKVSEMINEDFLPKVKANISKEKKEIEDKKKAEDKKRKEDEEKKKKEEERKRNKVSKINKDHHHKETIDGLQPHVEEARKILKEKFNVVIGGYREGDTDGMGTGHGDGLALDLMVPEDSELGDKISEYLINNFKELNISYIIWKQNFLSDFNSWYGPAWKWNPMPDRGGTTANHHDHVHISFKR